MAIDPQYVDVSIPRGCLPRESKVGDSDFVTFADTDIDAIPRSEWDGLLNKNRSLWDEQVLSRIFNQRSEGSCASNATCQALEIVWNMTFGIDKHVSFSPISIYRWVANSPNNGSTIEGNLRQLRDVGALPLDDPQNIEQLRKYKFNQQHVLKHTGYYQDFPQNWKDTSQNFCAQEWYEITSFEEFVTCLFFDFPVVYGRAGHAICGVHPDKRDGQWGIVYANSWNGWGFEDDAGRQGYGFDTERYISGSISSYGAWALRSIVMPEALISF